MMTSERQVREMKREREVYIVMAHLSERSFLP